jgi:hypothetical protein
VEEGAEGIVEAVLPLPEDAPRVEEVGHPHDPDRDAGPGEDPEGPPQADRGAEEERAQQDLQDAEGGDYR